MVSVPYVDYEQYPFVVPGQVLGAPGPNSPNEVAVDGIELGIEEQAERVMLVDRALDDGGCLKRRWSWRLSPHAHLLSANAV